MNDPDGYSDGHCVPIENGVTPTKLGQALAPELTDCPWGAGDYRDAGRTGWLMFAKTNLAGPFLSFEEIDTMRRTSINGLPL